MTLENEFKGVNYELKEDEDPHSKLKYGHTISDEQISAQRVGGNTWRNSSSNLEANDAREKDLNVSAQDKGDADEVDEDNYQGVGAQSCNPRSESDRGSGAGQLAEVQ